MGQPVRKSPRRNTPAMDAKRGQVRPKDLAQTYQTRDMAAATPRARRLHK